MAVGTQPSWSYLNAQATQIVLQARAAINAINLYNAYLQGLGVDNLTAIATAAQDATASDDVAELMSIFANLSSIAEACGGAAYTGPALPFDFVGQTVPLWNAQ